MKKINKLMICLLVIFTLTITMTSCKVATETTPTPTPTPTVVPTVEPTVEPTVVPTKRPSGGGGGGSGSRPTPPDPVPEEWAPGDELINGRTYILKDGVASVEALDFTGKFIVSGDYNEKVTIKTPKATIEISGVLTQGLDVTTGANTLTFVDGASVAGTVTVNGGNVDVQAGSTVDAMNITAKSNTEIVTISGTVGNLDIQDNIDVEKITVNIKDSAKVKTTNSDSNTVINVTGKSKVEIYSNQDIATIINVTGTEAEIVDTGLTPPTFNGIIGESSIAPENTSEIYLGAITAKPFVMNGIKYSFTSATTMPIGEDLDKIESIYIIDNTSVVIPESIVNEVSIKAIGKASTLKFTGIGTIKPTTIQGDTVDKNFTVENGVTLDVPNSSIIDSSGGDVVFKEGSGLTYNSTTKIIGGVDAIYTQNDADSKISFQTAAISADTVVETLVFEGNNTLNATKEATVVNGAGIAITEGSTLTVKGKLSVGATSYIFSDANSKIKFVNSGILVDGDGKVIGNGTEYNYNISEGASITMSPIIIENAIVGQEYIVDGNVTAGKNFSVDSGVTLTINKDGMLTIPIGKELTVNSQATLTNSGIITNNGRIMVNGTLINEATKTITNNGTITVEGIMTNSGNVIETGLINGLGSITGIVTVSKYEDWNGIDPLVGGGTYFFEGEETYVQQENLEFTGKLILKGFFRELTLNIPNATVEIDEFVHTLTVTAKDLIVLGSDRGANAAANLTVLGGNVNINADAYVSLEMIITGTADTDSIIIAGRVYDLIIADRTVGTELKIEIKDTADLRMVNNNVTGETTVVLEDGALLELPTGADIAPPVFKTADGSKDLNATVIGYNDDFNFTANTLNSGAISHDKIAVIDIQGIGKILKMGDSYTQESGMNNIRLVFDENITLANGETYLDSACTKLSKFNILNDDKTAISTETTGSTFKVVNGTSDVHENYPKEDAIFYIKYKNDNEEFFRVQKILINQASYEVSTFEELESAVVNSSSFENTKITTIADIVIPENASLDISGELINNFNLTNNGEIYLFGKYSTAINAKFTNSGRIFIYDEFLNSGEFINSCDVFLSYTTSDYGLTPGIIINDGTLTITDTGYLGVVKETTLINNSTMTNNGELSIEGTFTNNGTINGEGIVIEDYDGLTISAYSATTDLPQGTIHDKVTVNGKTLTLANDYVQGDVDSGAGIEFIRLEFDSNVEITSGFVYEYFDEWPSYKYEIWDVNPGAIAGDEINLDPTTYNIFYGNSNGKPYAKFPKEATDFYVKFKVEGETFYRVQLITIEIAE